MGRFDLDKRDPNLKDPFRSIEVARAYDLSIRSSMRIPMERVISRLSPFCKDGSQILDVGCNTGLLSLMLGGRHPNVNIFGIEENKWLLQAAEENGALAALVNYPGKVEFLHYSTLSDLLDIETSSVDIVFSHSSFHRLSDPVKTLKECNRVCKPDGFVLFLDLARDAEEGVICFILQYINSEQDRGGFMDTLKAAYTVPEIKNYLKGANISEWKVSREGVDLWITSRTL